MSDIFTDVIGSFVKRFKDMGDTSHAEVVYAVLDTAAGAGASIGAITDDAASSSLAETATARTGIGLWKGIKNVLILINAVLGATTGAAVITDATGTIQQYLRGIVKLLAAHITVKIEPQVLVAISGTVTATGPTPLIAAPGAGYRIALTELQYQNESATATTIQIHFGATATNGERLLGQNQGDGVVKVWPDGREWRGDDNQALNMTCDGANLCGWSAKYFTEAI